MFKRKYLHFKTLDSSSIYLKNRRSFLKNLTFVSCDFQTDGHGRLNRTWSSNFGENLLFSFLIKDKKIIEKVNGLSILIGVCVFKALKKLGVNNLTIKWPNDVYIGEKKVCGILLESVLSGEEQPYVIVGVGINVNQTEFLGEFFTTPTSLKLETNKSYGIKGVKKVVFKTIIKELKKFKKSKSEYLKTANQNNFLFGKNAFAEINGKKVEVIVKNINDDNTLSVVYNDNQLSVLSGEITFHV